MKQEKQKADHDDFVDIQCHFYSVLPWKLSCPSTCQQIECLAVVLQSRITLQLDFWEILREVHTFGTNCEIQQLYCRERESTHSPFTKKKNPSKNSKNKRHFIFVAFHIQTKTHWLISSFLTGSLKPRKLARDPHLNTTVTKQSHATNATYPIVSERFTASEILSFLLNVHGIRLSLRQLRRILKNRDCTR